MKLYCWLSDYLGDYGPGRIVVMAENVEEARKVAWEGFEVHVRDRYSYHFVDGVPLDEDSQSDIDSYRNQFRCDITDEPTECPGYLFVRGSA